LADAVNRTSEGSTFDARTCTPIEVRQYNGCSGNAMRILKGTVAIHPTVKTVGFLAPLPVMLMNSSPAILYRN
jgi:hypothetical protein